MIDSQNAVSQATILPKSLPVAGINVRGSFLCAQACLPHLVKATNAHILNLSPPINLSPNWLGRFPAYTASKYGMSLLALGWAGLGWAGLGRGVSRRGGGLEPEIDYFVDD